MFHILLTLPAFAGDCTIGASGLPCPDPTTLADVAESCEYRMVHDLSVPAQPNFSDVVPYDVNNEGTAATFDRVAYQYQLDGEWVWASMDDPTGNDPSLLGMPTSHVDPFVLNTTVTNLNLYSNHAGVTPGTGLAGNLEIWPHNYGASGDQGIGGNNSFYDFDDTPSGGDHGSFQVHDLSTNRTVFGLSLFNRGVECETGLGNAPSVHTDWTFSQTCNDYTTRRLRTYIRVDGEGCDEAPAGMTVPDVFPDVATYANTAYAGGDPVDAGAPNARLRPASLQASLEELASELATTCTLDTDVQTFFGGAYDRTSVTGEDGTGALLGGKDNPSRTFGGSSPELGLFGTDAGVFSTYTRRGRLLAKTDSGDFFAGRWVRVRGTRGIFVGLGGTCDAGGDIPTALAEWFDGDLAGW